MSPPVSILSIRRRFINTAMVSTPMSLPIWNSNGCRTPQDRRGAKLLKRDPMDRLKFTEPPKSVAILHCIGSRDKNYHEYCSRTCCMYALKYAHLLKDKCGHDTEVYNFYIDMRCFGKGYEEFYKRVQSEGVRMIRGKASRVDEKDGILTVTAEDTLSDRMLKVPVEMVILCTAMEARSDANEVARIFGISTGSDGFFQEEHPKLEPVSTPTSGVFLAGVCQGPKDIPDTVAQAKGAAAECSRPFRLRKSIGLPDDFFHRSGHLHRLPGMYRLVCILCNRVQCIERNQRGEPSRLQRLRKLRRILPKRSGPDSAFYKQTDFCGNRWFAGRLTVKIRCFPPI